MGAQFNFTKLRAKNDREAVQKMNAIIDQAAYDYGHAGYSGSFAEARGAKVCKVFLTDAAAAEKWLNENAEKWGPALIVKAEDGHYYAGAVCSS